MQGWSPAGAQVSVGAGYAGDGSRRAPQNIALLPPAAFSHSQTSCETQCVAGLTVRTHRLGVLPKDFRASDAELLAHPARE